MLCIAGWKSGNSCWGTQRLSIYNIRYFKASWTSRRSLICCNMYNIFNCVFCISIFFNFFSFAISLLACFHFHSCFVVYSIYFFSVFHAVFWELLCFRLCQRSYNLTFFLLLSCYFRPIWSLRWMARPKNICLSFNCAHMGQLKACRSSMHDLMFSAQILCICFLLLILLWNEAINFCLYNLVKTVSPGITPVIK